MWSAVGKSGSPRTEVRDVHASATSACPPQRITAAVGETCMRLDAVRKLHLGSLKKVFSLQ